MSTDNNGKKLTQSVKSSIEKIEKAEEEQKTIMAQTIYLGTIGIIFILPVIAGAYAGVWLDNRLTGFSFSWTVSLIFIGIAVGAINVYLFIRE